ncbi:putative two component response regulator receiver (CheY-like protein) corresponding to a FixJ-like fragment [Bradyrhizobium sp. ORS 278]|uniref:response regulator n=1 Tax=Bradyrhizobium sp. (strain ORS 278) TaxID=114615 RepID=UPI00015079E6|nr:response regulator [Bradyrhizobium sp. ORS 278]CAL76258.1 putative two component response regulator receiver (CheY-like protein) corresponding to a FixJ-like fragment [Bradyrhizobium sp. ORS 278]
MSALAKPKVYVADDDADVLGSLRFLLEADGFDVRTFRSGNALLKASDRAAVDCFVVDYKMPELNGVEVADRLRKQGATAPVVLITGHYDDRLAARAAAVGIQDFLLKPLLDDNLVKRIRKAIANDEPVTAP